MNDQHFRRRIGILGGMGPEATVLLMARVIAATCAQDDADHVPMLVDNNTQVPSRIKAIIEKTGADPGPPLVEMARRLEAGGAQALAMPCNTAHHYAPVIASAVEIPLLNMVELSAARIGAMKLTNRRIGLLASPAVRLTEVFDQALRSHQIKTIYPADENRMLDAIRAVKKDSNDKNARLIMEDAARELMENGADCLLIACSELSIIGDAVPPIFPCIDTIDVLAQAVVDFSGAERHSGNTDAVSWKKSA